MIGTHAKKQTTGNGTVFTAKHVKVKLLLTTEIISTHHNAVVMESMIRFELVGCVVLVCGKQVTLRYISIRSRKRSNVCGETSIVPHTSEETVCFGLNSNSFNFWDIKNMMKMLYELRVS